MTSVSSNRIKMLEVCCVWQGVRYNAASCSTQSVVSSEPTPTAVGFNVDDIARQHFLFLQAVIYGGVKLQLLCALDCLQAYDDMGDDFTIASCLQAHNETRLPLLT